jgi:prephenate dehydrogenase
VVTDGGSTKQDVVALARRLLKGRAAQFVPGHPIAGAEHSGVTAARAGLFSKRKVVLTPLPENSVRSIRRVRAAWRACGARLYQMQPAEHDRVFAAVSHLPHLLSYALVDLVARHPNGKQLFDYAAGGFRDFTRIASSHPEMWRDICVANRKALLRELEGYERELGEVKRLLRKGDAAGLEKVFARARTARNKWLQKQQ